MKTKKILKNQKPIDIDAHIKYRCPDKDCGFDHWISLKEAKTKKFKIVCDCGCVFLPRTICKIKIFYKTKTIKNTSTQKNNNEKQEIPLDTAEVCVKILIGYGFTKKESIDLLSNAYKNCENKEPTYLIRFILQNLEKQNVN